MKHGKKEKWHLDFSEVQQYDFVSLYPKPPYYPFSMRDSATCRDSMKCINTQEGLFT